ncbi:MAG TPA: MgtC/SapB family protein, partial [Candidatus Eisenbacteria bacterium]|nr:MgtC/SapB family protein [Candidatus Eisenbacteria bacterium]
MHVISNELIGGLPSAEQLASLTVRLVLAMILGAVIGIQRERSGKPAGIRTHILVALGSTLLVIAPMEFGMDAEGLSRVIQGLITGIGFLGAGAILKLEERREVEGLTTAAGIWMTAAIGLALGLGRLGLALVSTALTWITLAVIGKLERKAKYA